MTILPFLFIVVIFKECLKERGKNVKIPPKLQTQAVDPSSLEVLNRRSLVVLSSSKAKQKAASKSKSTTRSLWLASNTSKRWGEIFFLAYTPFWLPLCLGIVVPYKLYESFTELEYMLLGLISALPTFLILLILVGKVDRSMHLKDRYWVKANLWIVIFNYVGNYFWTHYFFTVLGASYTFPSWKMNDFPYYQFVDRASMYKVGSLFYAIYFVVSFPMFLRIDEKPDSLWDLPRVAVDAWVLLCS